MRYNLTDLLSDSVLVWVVAGSFSASLSYGILFSVPINLSCLEPVEGGELLHLVFLA